MLRPKRRRAKRAVQKIGRPISAHNRYSAASQQVLTISVTLAKMLGFAEPVGDIREDARQRRLEPLLKELESEGIYVDLSRSTILAILIVYINPIEQPRLDEAARRLSQYQKLVSVELKTHERLHAALKADFSIWPLSPTPVNDLIQDCTAGIDQLRLLLSKLDVIRTILRTAEAASTVKRAKKGKSARPAARRAEWSLMKFLKGNGLSVAKAADYTQRIMEAWEPSAASASSASIRVRFTRLSRP